MFTTGQTQANVLASVQSKLVALRSALDAVAQEYKWSSGVAVSDLVALGFTTADANSILSAVADSNALADYYNSGHPTQGSYPQPTSSYIFGASAAAVIGP